MRLTAEAHIRLDIAQLMRQPWPITGYLMLTSTTYVPCDGTCLVEQTEAHVFIGLFLLFLLGLLLLFSGSLATSGRGSSTGSSGATTRWNTGKFLGTRGNELSRHQ